MESHLLQMRGLKLQNKWSLSSHQMSHLLQMRGLKLIYLLILLIAFCRIFYRCVD